MKTTREERAAIVADVNANFAVDNLRPSALSKELDELYIEGKATLEELIEALNHYYAMKYPAKDEERRGD